MAEDPKNPITDKMKSELERIQSVARETGPAELGQQPRFVPGKGVVVGKSSLQDVLERLKSVIMSAVSSKNDTLKDNVVKSIMFETKLPEDAVKAALNAYVDNLKKPAKPQAAAVTEAPPDLPEFTPTGEVPEGMPEDLPEVMPEETPAAVAPSAPAAGAPTQSKVPAVRNAAVDDPAVARLGQIVQRAVDTLMPIAEQWLKDQPETDLRGYLDYLLEGKVGDLETPESAVEMARAMDFLGRIHGDSGINNPYDRQYRTAGGEIIDLGQGYVDFLANLPKMPGKEFWFVTDFFTFVPNVENNTLTVEVVPGAAPNAENFDDAINKVRPGADNAINPEDIASEEEAPKEAAKPVSPQAVLPTPEKPATAPKKLDKIPPRGSIYRYEFEPIERGNFDPNQVRGLLIHSGTPGIKGYPEPAIPGDTDSNLDKIRKGTRKETTRSYDVIPQAKIGDVINVGTEKDPHYARLTGKFQVLGFDRDNGLVAMRDLSNQRIFTRNIREIAAAEGYNARSFANSRRTFSHPDKFVPNVNIPQPIERLYDTRPTPAAVKPKASIVPGNEPPAPQAAQQAAPAPAAKPAPAPAAPSRSAADIQQDMMFAFKLPAGPERQKIMLELTKELSALESAVSPAEPQGVVQTPPQGETPVSVAPTAISGDSGQAVTAPTQKIATAPTRGGEKFPPISEAIGSAVMPSRVRVPGIEDSGSRVDAHFVNAYFSLIQEASKIKEPIKGVVDDGTLANLKHIMGKRTSIAKRDQAVKRLTLAYRIRGKYLVYLALAGQAPKNAPPVVVSLFTKIGKELKANLIKSGVDPDVVGAMQRAIIASGGLGIREPRGQKSFGPSGQRAIERIMATHEYINQNPSVIESNPQYAGMIDYMISSMRQSLDVFETDQWQGFNPYFEDDNIMPVDYEQRYRAIWDGAGYWQGIDDDALKNFCRSILFEMVETEDGRRIPKFSVDPVDLYKTMGTPWAKAIADMAAADPESAEVDAEIKKAISRIYRAIVAYEEVDKNGRRSGIRDVWLDENGFITEAQKWLDAYGLGGDYQMDKSARIDYRPGLDFAPADIEPRIRDGFNQFMNRHPWLFPVLKGQEAESVIRQATGDQAYVGDYGSLGAYGFDRVSKLSAQLTLHNMRSLPAGSKLVLIENKSNSEPISVALYDAETGKPTDVEIVIRPGRFGVAFADEVSAYSVDEQVKFDIEITDMPTEWIAYRPVVNSELSQVYQQSGMAEENGMYSLVANASGVGTLKDAVDNQHEMNGFAKLTVRPGITIPDLETPGNLQKWQTARGGIKNAMKVWEVLYDEEPMVRTIAAVPSALQPDQPVPNQMVSVSVFVGYEKKRRQQVFEPAGELVARREGAEIRTLEIGGEQVFGVIPYELEDDTSKPIYRKIEVPAVLLDPSLDPESPLLRNPRLSALRDLIVNSAEMQGANLSVRPRPEMTEVMASRSLTGEGAFQVIANGKRPGTPILEGLGLSGDQAVSESVAEQFDGDAEFYQNRKWQQELATEGGLPKDTMGDILEAESYVESAEGRGPDVDKFIWEGKRPASSPEHIASVIEIMMMRYRMQGVKLSSEQIQRQLRIMTKRMEDKTKGVVAKDVADAVNRIMSSREEKVPYLEETKTAKEKIITVPDEAIAKIGESEPADIMARLMQDYVDFEIFVARKLHYSTVKSDRAPDNQNMNLPYDAVADIIDSVSGLDTVRGTLHKSEIDRVADYLVDRIDPTKRRLYKEVYPTPKDTNSVFDINTNPAILQYPGAKKKGAQEEIEMAWKIATDAEKNLIEGFNEGIAQNPMPLLESAEQTLAAPKEEVSFGQKWNKNLSSRPSRRGETVASLLRASKITMEHMEAIISDGSFVKENGELFEKIGIAVKSEDGNTYTMRSDASFQKTLPVGTVVSIPADDAAMRDLEGAKTLVAKPVAQEPVAVDPDAENKIAKAKFAIANATEKYNAIDSTFQDALKEQKRITEKYKDEIEAGQEPEELKKIKRKIEIISANRTRTRIEIDGYKKTIADLSAAGTAPRVQTFAVPTGPYTPVENVYEKLRKMIALGGESRKRAQRIIKLAERIYSHNLSTQRRGVFGQLVRQIERASANISRSSIIEAIGYGKLPETWQAEVDPAFIEDQQFRRYPEVISQDESGNVTYMIDDFGPSNPIFRGTQEDAYSEDGETATWRLVQRLVSKGRVGLVLVQNADGTFEFGLMAVEKTQTPEGKFMYKAKESAIDTKSTSIEAMQQYLESVGLDAYVNIMTSFDEFVPPQYDENDTTPQKERIRIENELREEYLRKQRMVLAEQKITGFEADVLMQQYELEMNKDFFTIANPELAEKPETALFDSAINMKFYLDLASKVELSGVSLKGVLPEYMLGKDGALLGEQALYSAMVTNSQYHLGVVKNRSIAMESNSKVKTRRLAVGEGQLDYLAIREANQRLKADVGEDTRGRANAILDLAIMKAEQKGFGYDEFDTPIDESTRAGKTGPTGPGGIGRYTRSVARGTLGAAGVLALLHELKYGKYDYQDESASLGETLGKKAESYAPMLGVIGGAEAISRLPVLGKAAGPAAGLAMLGYTAATGGDTLRTAIGLLGGAVGGIGGAIFTGGVGAMAGGIAGGVIADEIYSKVTGQDSLIDFRPMDTTSRKVVQAPSLDTRSNLEERYTSGG